MWLLGFGSLDELQDWMNKAERPTRSMMPPDQLYRDMQPFIEAEECIYSNPQ